MDIREFFEGMLPAVIQKRAAFFDNAQGSACLIVHGVGAWTIHFGDHRSANALTAGIDLDADLVATWGEAGFAALLAGESDPARVAPIVMGKANLLEKVGNLMLPPAKGGLGARLMGL